MKSLIVNGKSWQYAPESFPGTITGLAKSLGLQPGSFVAEVNGSVISRDNHDKYSLNDGDTVELVRFVGGG